MKEINNLTYTLEINYTNKDNLSCFISIKLCDNGLEMKSIKVGDICVTEETINGRILSGRIENLDNYCGYKFDYQNGENLLILNPDVSLSDTISLINNTKMSSDFLSANLVLSSISRNDYRVVILDDGCLSVTKLVSAENEKSEVCSVQENINLIKLEGEKSFVEQNRKRVYKINNNTVFEDYQTPTNNNLKQKLNKLSDIIIQCPQNYKNLIELKNQTQKLNVNDSSNEEKMI